MAQNICKCPDPPGGEVTCGPKQIAICWVQNGVVNGYCIDVPKTIAGRMKTVRQAILDPKFSGRLGTLLLADDDDRVDFKVDSSFLLEVLGNRMYHDSGRDVEVTIKLPPSMKF